MEIELTYSPAPEDRQAVKSGMRAYELSVLPGLPSEDEDVLLAAYVRRGDGSVCAGACHALYFAGQGAGRMALPVGVTFVRFLAVAAIGALAVSFAWDIAALFIAVAAGLTIMGIGQAHRVLGPAWRGT